MSTLIEKLERELVGKTFSSNKCGDFVVTSYKDAKNVGIRFLFTGTELVVESSNIRKGTIKDRNYPSYQGVGIIGDKYSTYNKGKKTKEYALWCSMLDRCYSNKLHEKYPTYKDCSVSKNFAFFTFFVEWCRKQTGFNQSDFNLDKDLLIKGNKIYSENACCFLPKEVNIALTKRENLRGDSPIGVKFCKFSNKFTSRICRDGKFIHLGYFDDELTAFNAYKIEKEQYLQELAYRYKGRISDSAYYALISYQVDVMDQG